MVLEQGYCELIIVQKERELEIYNNDHNTNDFKLYLHPNNINFLAMIEELAHLIKQDEESQNLFQKLANDHKENVKLQENQMLKRARRVALTLGFAGVLVVVTFTFALITKMKSDENIQILDSQLNNTRIELAECLKGVNN